MSAVDEILSQIRVGNTFATFEEVENLVSQLTKECYYPLKYVSRRTVESHNNKKGAKQIATKWRYQSANILCSHYGTHRNRSTGVIPNQNVYASGCTFGFRVTFDSTIEVFKIQWANLEHSGHAISQDHIKTYLMKENLSADALNFAERALVAGAVPDRARTQLQLEFGAHVNSKFLQNVKQSVIGLPKDEWARACSLLQCYAEQPGNVVRILHDEENIITVMYVQVVQQREMYKKYGEMVQLDGTYNVNRLSMPLYTLSDFGVGQPISYFFVKDETWESIMDGLRIFAEFNDVSRTTVVITDKDCREMTSVSAVFSDCQNSPMSLPCPFSGR